SSSQQLSHGRRQAVVARPETTQPNPPPARAADVAICRSLAPARSHLPSLSERALRRHHPRQEPDAVTPPVRICGGGPERSGSLLRLKGSDPVLWDISPASIGNNGPLPENAKDLPSFYN